MTISDSQQTILVVDDEPSVRKLLRRCFERESYNVVEAENGSEMHRQLKNNSVDLITLDLSLGKENGLNLARDIRATSTIPIIMVSGKGELIDTIVGLEMGADDYINKPFELREVIARVRAVLRRHDIKSKDAEATTSGGQYAFGQWILDTSMRELQDAEANICALTTGEYQLLEYLIHRSRQVLSRDQIMDGLKGSEWLPNDRSIDNQVARLRKKLSGASTENPTTFIKTVRGAGYMFTPEVRQL